MLTSGTHIISCPIGDTGHLRPMLSVIANIIRAHPHVLITLFVLKSLVAKVNDEFARSGCADVSRIRVIGLSDIDFVDGADRVFRGPAVEELRRLAPLAYESILAGGTLTCSATGTKYDYSTIPKPALALSDIMTPFFAEAIKRITPKVKVLVNGCVTASFFQRTCAPKELGGMGRWGADIKELMERNPSMSFDEAALSFLTFTGAEYPNPEGLKIYDYEFVPQLESSAGNNFRTNVDAIRQVNEVVDGTIVPITESWEPETSRSLRQWYEKGRGKKIFFVGQHYLSKPLNQSLSKNPEIVSRYPLIFNFLDAQPPRSVWLISFGSVYYPYAHPEQLYTVIRTLLKNQRPFILTRAGWLTQKSEPIPQALVEEVESSGLGLIVEYAPQEVVLNHPSLRAFVTHGGVNSIQETVQAGVIPILWPFDVDQPFNAAYLSDNVDCAFELLQVRTGPGAQPPARGGTVVGTEEAIAGEVTQIIKDLGGEVGERKRRNLDAFRATFLKELGEGGEVSKAIDDIVSLASTSTE